MLTIGMKSAIRDLMRFAFEKDFKIEDLGVGNKNQFFNKIQINSQNLSRKAYFTVPIPNYSAKGMS